MYYDQQYKYDQNHIELSTKQMCAWFLGEYKKLQLQKIENKKKQVELDKKNTIRKLYRLKLKNKVLKTKEKKNV